jgi:hypothetical protein
MNFRSIPEKRSKESSWSRLNLRKSLGSTSGQPRLRKRDRKKWRFRRMNLQKILTLK